MICHNYLKNQEKQIKYRKMVMKKLIIIINKFIEKGLLYIFIACACINILMLFITHLFEIKCIDYIWQSYIDYIANNVFAEKSRDFLINVLSILSGFVITIISVFGIGYSKATIKICEGGLEKKFCRIAKGIIYVSIVLLAIIVFAYDIRKNEICISILSLALMFVMIRFILFSIVVIKMFDYNMKDAKKESEEDIKRNKEIISLLRKIANDDVNIGDYENSKAYSEKMRENG